MGPTFHSIALHLSALASCSLEIQGPDIGSVQDGAHPLTVLQKILDGARKWMGPFFGLEFILFLRKRSYFIFCRTRPPETVISSARTMTYVGTEVLFRRAS